MKEKVAPAPVSQLVMHKTESDDRTEPVAKVMEAASQAKVDFATDLFNMLSVDSSSTENGSGEASASDNSWAGFQFMEAASQAKVDFATDLFNMLSVDSSSTENGSGEASASDNSWAGFQSAQQVLMEKIEAAKAPEKNTQSANGIEDLFADSPSIASPFMQEKPQKDVKSDIMSLFDKSNMVSPFAIHQQQLAMLAQQQSLLMAAAATNAGGGMQKVPQTISNLTPQSMMNPGYQLHGMVMAGSGNNDLGKYVQQIGSTTANQPVGNAASFLTSSSYPVGHIASSNGVSATAPYSAGLTQGKEYDFSSLTQGFFSKQ